jgi:hypothetical protein
MYKGQLYLLLGIAVAGAGGGCFAALLTKQIDLGSFASLLAGVGAFFVIFIIYLFIMTKIGK